VSGHVTAGVDQPSSVGAWSRLGRQLHAPAVCHSLQFQWQQPVPRHQSTSTLGALCGVQMVAFPSAGALHDGHQRGGDGVRPPRLVATVPTRPVPMVTQGAAGRVPAGRQNIPPDSDVVWLVPADSTTQHAAKTKKGKQRSSAHPEASSVEVVAVVPLSAGCWASLFATSHLIPGLSVSNYTHLTAASTTAATIVVESPSACTCATEVGAIVSAGLHHCGARPPRPWQPVAWPRTPVHACRTRPRDCLGSRVPNTPETKRHRDGGSTCTHRGSSFQAAFSGGARRKRRPPRRWC